MEQDHEIPDDEILTNAKYQQLLWDIKPKNKSQKTEDQLKIVLD